MFEQSLVLQPPTNKRWTFAVSLALQMAALSVLVLIPLIYTERLSQAIVRGSLFAPTPPPAPPPPAVQMEAPPSAALQNAVRPRAVDPVVFLRNFRPRPLADIVNRMFHDGEPLPAPSTPCPNCVVGGTGLAPGAGFGSFVPVAPPPPPPPAETRPEPPRQIRIGGEVLAANIVKRVLPVYPPLAKQARISGTVRLQGKISRDGRILDLQVLSGHPLLVAAAVDAVRQWVYRPTLLNGDPVEVIAPIEVNFTLNR